MGDSIFALSARTVDTAAARSALTRLNAVCESFINGQPVPGSGSAAPASGAITLPAVMTHLDKAVELMDKQAAIARRYGLPLITYEGGQHLIGLGPVRDNARVNALFDSANRDPRMGRIYSRYLAEWNRASGGKLYVNLLDCAGMSKEGRWGMIEFPDQPRSEAPKYDAIQRWIKGAE